MELLDNAERNSWTSDQLLQYNPTLSIPIAYDPSESRSSLFCSVEESKDDPTSPQPSNSHSHMQYTNPSALLTNAPLQMSTLPPDSSKSSYVSGPSTQAVVAVDPHKKTDLNSSTWPKQSNQRCLHCTFGFDTVPLLIPLDYRNGQFTVLGNLHFCSLGCLFAYQDRQPMSVHRRTEMQTMVLLMYEQLTQRKVTEIVSAPAREVLSCFCGTSGIGIDEFRAASGQAIQTCFPPIRPLSMMIHDAKPKPIPVSCKGGSCPIKAPG